jgi:hypothetical protein
LYPRLSPVTDRSIYFGSSGLGSGLASLALVPCLVSPTPGPNPPESRLQSKSSLLCHTFTITESCPDQSTVSDSFRSAL